MISNTKLFSVCFGDVASWSKPRSATRVAERGDVQLHVKLNVVCRVAERGFLHEATSERQIDRERKKQRGREVCVQLLVLFSLFLPLSINLSLSHY